MNFPDQQLSSHVVATPNRRRYHMTRALRCATIALFLGVGFEGLKHVVFHNLSTGQAHVAAILLCASIIFVLSWKLLSREQSLHSKFLEDIIRSFPESACVVDDAGRFKQWNSTFEKLLGYTAQEIAEITALDTIAEEQREIVQQATTTALTDGMARVESVLMSKDGVQIPCLLTGVRIVLNDQPCLLGIAVDLTKLRQAEESLRASEAEYESLIASIPEVVWKSDSVGGVGFVGPGIETILGYSPAEVYQRGDSVWTDSIHVDDRQRVKQAFESLLNEGKPYDVECRVQRKSGEWFWAHDRAVTTGEKDGIRFATGLLSDITERKAWEEGLQKLASIVEFSEDAITAINTDGVITTWNPAAERMYGYASTEVIGRDFSFMLSAERQTELRVIMERVQEGLAIECLETQRLNKAGSVLDVSLSISPIKDASGRVTGASTIARDITGRKRAEEQLKLQSAALEAAANAIVITESHGTIVWVNHAFTTMTGYSKEEVLGKNPRLLKSGEQPQSYYADLWSTISSGKVWHGELINKRADGTTYNEEMTITPVTRDVGNPADRYFVAIKQDITARKQAEKELRLAKFSLERASDNIFWSNSQGHFVYVNEAACDSLGYSREELLSLSVPDLNPRFRKKEGWPTFWEKLKRRGSITFEGQNTSKQGRVFPVEVTSNYLEFDGQEYSFAFVRDITDRKLAEDRIQYLALYDGLTGLPNRTLLQDRVAKALADARRQSHKIALLFLDLDRFKDVNDSLGHSVGDLLLQNVAERLKTWGREQDTVARLGGDEFLIMLTDVRDVPDVAVAAERLMNAMTAEFIVQGHALSIGCSVGISIFPEHGADCETLIKNADAAMYRAKADGNNFRFFTEDMNAQVVERLALERGMRLALAKEEFFVVYQPQMDIPTGKIVGLEVLLRWKHPDLGLVPPDKFIRIAENCGLIGPIGEWVLRTACSQARKWQDEGIPPITIAVNVSAIQFRQEGFCELIRRVLQETGFPPQYLELELTESLLLANAELMASVVQKLKAMGVTLAIDDFGTGYSSFSYLKQLRINKLKIDRSFIRDVTADPDDAAITAAIISMAKSLHLKVIAEGVENEAQMSFLRAHHCDEIQGYYFSKPLTVDKVADKLRGDCPEPHVRAQASGAQS